MEYANKKVSGIILAAGSASRMGKTKQLLPFKGRPILEHVISNARLSNLYEIIVVLGQSAKKIQHDIDLTSTKTIINNEYIKGQSTSLIKGLEKISPLCDAAMFLLADQPLITPVTINTIIKAFENSNLSITIPYYNDIRGNPVIIAKSLFQNLKSLSGDTGPRILFNNFKDSILKVPVQDKAILIDVDTQNDYKKLISIV